MALWRNGALVVLAFLVSGVCLHAGAASLRRARDVAPSQGIQQWKPLFLCVEEERECGHVWSSNFTEEFRKCSVFERRYCVPQDKAVDCCTNVSSPSIVEVCSHLTRSSAKVTVSCRQFRRELSTASDEPTNQSSLHMILPKGASSSQIYGLGGTQDLVRTSIYLKANQSQRVSFNDTVLTHKGVQMHFKSNHTEGWYRILVRQRTTEAVGVTFEAVSSVIYYYTMLTSEAVSGGGFDSHFPWNWYCSVFGTAYHWEYGQFTECSTSCGIGKKYKRAVCKDNYSGGRVDDAKCDCHDPPPVVVVSCATKLCEPRWVAGMWSNCSESCGRGYQQREVTCIRDISEDKFEIVREHEVDEVDYCNTEERPSSLRQCKGQLCLFVWIAQEWTTCSSRCGNGTQDRVVKCHSLNGTVVSDSNCLEQKPDTRQSCNLNPQCYFEWGQPSEWGKCHGNCRESTNGMRYRTVRCLAKHTGGRILSDSVSEQFCEADKKPIDSTSCNLNCSLGEWRVVGSIQECNATCGTNVYKVKKLACFNDKNVIVENRLCPYRPSTFISERCDVPLCPPPPNCVDLKWSGYNCTELIQLTDGLCDSSLRQFCCKTCHLLYG